MAKSCVWKLIALWLTTGLFGCGGGSPTPPPANPYAGESSTPPPTAASPSTAPPANATNPFGGPAPAPPSTNPFGGPSTASKPAAKPAPSTPAKPAPQLAATEKSPPPKTSPQPAPATASESPMPEKPIPEKMEKPDPVSPPASTAPATKPQQVASEDSPKGWSLAADPAPADSYAPRGLQFSLKAPNLGALGAEFLEAGRLRVLHPATPGAFVALGLNDDKKQFREVWSIADKRKLGQIRNLEFGSSRAQTLSPDGKYLAGKPQWDSAISVFSLEQNKALPPLKLNGQSCKLIAFAGKSRLVFEDNKELRIFGVPGLTQSGAIKLGSWKIEDGWALSGGGRYFAASTRQGAAAGISLFDLDNPASPAVVVSNAANVQGTAFSPDGQQFAALVGSPATNLMVWSIKNGAVAGNLDLGSITDQITPIPDYQGPRILWLPDNRHLLLGGRAVVDIQTGKVIHKISTPTLYAIQPVAVDQLAILQSGSLINLDLSASLKTPESPETEPQGTPDPAPVATEEPADRSMVTQTELEEVEWSVKPSRPLEPMKTRSNGIEIPTGFIYLGCLPHTGSGSGYVMYTSSAFGLGSDELPTIREGSKAWLEPLDMKSGEKQKIVPLPAVALLMNISPDGMQACFQNLDGLNHLEIRMTRDGSLKTSFAPYQDAEPGSDQRVIYAEFIDSLSLLTASSRRLTRWDLMTHKAIWELEIGEMRPELSPGRNYVAVSEPGGRVLYLVDLHTGRSAGFIPLTSLEGEQLSTCAFHPNGRFLATVSQRIDGGDVAIFSLEDGQPKERFPLPISARIAQWVGDDSLLLNGTYLVSVNRECVVWNYALPAGMHLRDSPDQRHWYIAADPGRANAYTVRGVDMPDSNVIQRVGAANLRGKTLLAPDGTIDIDVQVTETAQPGENPNGLPGSPGAGQGKEFSVKARNILIDRYQSAGIKLSSAASVKLTVRNRDEGGYQITLTSDEKPVWKHTLEGDDISQRLLQFEPPKYAFPAGAELGAGKSTLTVRGAQ